MQSGPQPRDDGGERHETRRRVCARISGRVIAALASDPAVMKHSGGTFITAEVARHYGITDIDSKVVPSLRAERGAPIWRPIAEAGDGR